MVMATKRPSSSTASQRKLSKAQIEGYNKFLQDELTKFIGKGGPPGGRVGPPIGLPAAVPLAQFGEQLKGAATAAKASHSSAVSATPPANARTNSLPFAGVQQWPGHVTQWPGHLAHYHAEELATVAKRSTSPSPATTADVSSGQAGAAALRARQEEAVARAAAEAAELKARGEAEAKTAAEAAKLKARQEAEAEAAAEAAKLKARLEADAKAEMAELKRKLEVDAEADEAALKAQREAEVHAGAEAAELEAKKEVGAKATVEAMELKMKSPELAPNSVVVVNNVGPSEVNEKNVCSHNSIV